jgi:hypothetical protein
MLNKLLPRTPFGIALTAVSVILAVSPEARKMTRSAAVKGLSAVLSLVDQLKAATMSTQNQLSELVQEARRPAAITDITEETKPLTHDTNMEPHEYSQAAQPAISSAFNVINDDYVKKQALHMRNETH